MPGRIGTLLTVLAFAAFAGSLAATPALAAVPGAPTSVTAAATDGEATVSFTAPASDGGSSITGYTVTASPGGARQAAAASPITIDGLTDGTSYTFTVIASNSDGPSVSSDPSAPVTPLATPAASVDPAITGTAEVDQTLGASTGTWSGEPTSFAYQWLDCHPASACEPIDGATDSTYTVGPFDGGSEIEVAVTATNVDDESGSGASAASAVVTAQPGAPVSITAPVPSTDNAVGAAARDGSAGTWSQSPTSFEYIWLSCASDLSSCTLVGGDQPSYTPTMADDGNVLILEVVASNADGDSVVAVSQPSAPVSFAPPPAISVSFPVNGASYPSSAVAGPPSYTCTPGTGTTVTSCSDSLTPFGLSLPNSPGQHSFEVFATDSDQQTATAMVTYTIVSGTGNQPGGVVLIGPPKPITPTTPVILLPSSTAPLTVTALAQSLRRWRAGKALPLDSPGSPPSASASAMPGVGTTFSFTASANAEVNFSFNRRESGRRKGESCVAPTRSNRHHKACTRTVPAGDFTVEAADGLNYVSFDGAMTGSKPLAPAPYFAAVTAVSGFGPGPTVPVGALHFTIVK